MKPSDDDDRDEAAVIEFFKSRLDKRGWTVENPAPSIPRVSCYVLERGTVHVTEYKGCSFSVYVQVETEWDSVLTALQTLDDVGAIEKFEAQMARIQDDLDDARRYGESMRAIANAGGPVGGVELGPPPWQEARR